MTAKVANVLEMAIERMTTPETVADMFRRKWPDIATDMAVDRLKASGIHMLDPGSNEAVALILRVEDEIYAEIDRFAQPERRPGRPSHDFMHDVLLASAFYWFTLYKQVPRTKAFKDAAKLLGGPPAVSWSAVQKAERRFRMIAPHAFATMPYATDRFDSLAFLSIGQRRMHQYILDTIKLLIECNADREAAMLARMPRRHLRRNPVAVSAQSNAGQPSP